jgi:predicted anti-sigma-YlaC factor YlaD
MSPHNKVNSHRLPEDAHTSLTPCLHMRTLISVAVDGSLVGVLHRFTHGHIAKCPPCRQTYNGLIVLRQRLQQLGQNDRTIVPQTLGETRWAQIEEAWVVVDSGKDSNKNQHG